VNVHEALESGSIYFETVPGSAFRKGPPCDACEYEFGPMSKGMVVKTEGFEHGAPEEGFEECLVCGSHRKMGKEYGPRQTGRVRLLWPSDNDSIADNEYLNGSVCNTDFTKSEEWFKLPLNDLGNSKRLVQLHGFQCRHVHQWGWLVYDGRRWFRDVVGAMPRFAKGTVMRMQTSLDDTTAIDRMLAKDFAKHAFASGSAGKIQSMVQLAASDTAVAARFEDFDRHGWLLNVRNGVLDLTTGQLRPHDPELNITQLVNIEFHPEAQCPRWLRFLEEMFLGDAEMLSFIQKSVGYTLTGEVTEQRLFFLYGDGANGKTTFLETLRKLMGDYTAHVPFEAFLASRDAKPDNTFANVPGKRFVTASEAGEMRSFNESMLKAFTGEETLSARLLYQEAFEFKPTAKLWLAANSKPTIKGVDEGIWRRFFMIPCQADIPPEKRDPRLGHALEEELQGILAWAVRGALDWWRTRPIKTPAKMQEALDDYRLDNDVMSRFVAETGDLVRSEWTRASLLLQEYNAWAKKNNEAPLNDKSLSERMRKFRGGILTKRRNGAGQSEWVGIRLTKTHLSKDPPSNDLRAF
jgi:putative DNA primase/helicase